MTRKINLAIVGATGLVGQTFLKVLEEKSNIEIANLYLFASPKSKGEQIKFRGKKYKVIELNNENIIDKKIDFALFSAGGSVSKEFAKEFSVQGAVVIDNSSAFRMDDKVPLVVPEVNINAIKKGNKLIANPNCSTIQCMLPLKALHDKFKLNRVQFVTYQAVSGSGMKGINDLEKTRKGGEPEFYPYPIFDNLIPHIDKFLENGYTGEEMKMVNETRKILDLPDLKITATCVRVPIKMCHSVEIYAEFENAVDMDIAKKALANFENIVLLDDVQNNIYPTPLHACNQDKVLVGRLRKGLIDDNAMHIFCVADNVRKGAASNAVQIMEKLLA